MRAAHARIAVDANQRWDVGTAIGRIQELAPFRPWWIEEPTSPDDVLGHAAIAEAVAPLRIATGEHIANQVVFKPARVLEFYLSLSLPTRRRRAALLP